MTLDRRALWLGIAGLLPQMMALAGALGGPETKYIGLSVGYFVF